MRFCGRCLHTFEDANPMSCPACATDRPHTDWPVDRRLGQTVAGGQYRILRRLGAGGFGVVYLVETVVGGLRRALKVLHTEWCADAVARDRFINEAVVLEQVNHPHVARCYAVGALEEDDSLYILFELVDGAQLSDLLDNGPRREPLSPERAVRFAKQIASGLAVAHANDVLHRDLKPDNILVVESGTPQEAVKLIDFGIAKSITQETTVATGGLVGTPSYMAPEQIRGAPLDARVDLWQLGATLHWMLTGQIPYPMEGGVAELQRQHQRRLDAGPSPSDVHPALEAFATLDSLVSRLLATSSDRRPRSATQVVEELAQIEHTLGVGTMVTGSVGLLEALCATPSEGAWWALCRYLSSQLDQRERLVTTAERLLAMWPDAIRQAPVSWWEAVKHGGEHPLWPLVRALDLSGRSLTDADVVELADTPALSMVTDLSLANNQIGAQGVAALAGSAHVTALRRLDLSGNRLTSAAAERLVESATLVTLSGLRLASNGLGPKGARALAASPLPLRDLDLSDNDIQADGASALASSASLSGLERLSLGGNHLGSDGTSALSVSHTLTVLRELDVRQNGIGPAGVAALALSANVGRLRTLNLSQNSLGVEGVELLLQSNRFGSLEVLFLSSNAIGAQGAMALGSSPFARRLKELDVGDNQLGDAGLAALLGAPHLSGVRKLTVAQNGITAAGVSLFGGALPELAELDLSRNPLGEEGAAALASALPRMRVDTLGLAGSGLGGKGLAEVIAAGRGVLASLGAASNELGPEGALRLSTIAEAASLQRIDVSGNRLGPTGVQALGRSPYLKNLRSLVLDSNEIGDEGGGLLTHALDTLPNLEGLRAEDNGLGPKTAAALATSPLAGRLVELDLAYNRLGDAGAMALAQGRNWHALRRMNLQGNDISLAAAASLLSSPSAALLTQIDISHNALQGQVDLHSLADREVDLLETSFAKVAGNRADVAERFYARLFERYPAVKPLFAHVSMRRQQQHLMDALATVIDNLRTPDSVEPTLVELGRRHIKYGVCPSHYHAVTTTLIATLRESVGEEWSEELDDAWHDGLQAVTSIMLRAHRERADDAPAVQAQ